jgi:hypothetical protein
MNVKDSPDQAHRATSVIGTQVSVHRLIDKDRDLHPNATATTKFDESLKRTISQFLRCLRVERDSGIYQLYQQRTC